MLGRDATEEQTEALRERLGLNEPVPVQFLNWFGKALRLDFGESLFIGKPVTQALLDRAEPTGLLALYSLTLSILIAVPAGIIAAVRANSALDRLLMVVSISGVAIPSFFLGILLNLFFAVVLGWLPVGRVRRHRKMTKASNFRYMLLPR